MFFSPLITEAAYDTAAEISSIIIILSVSADKNRAIIPFFFFCSRRFFPFSARRFDASAEVSPTGEVERAS